MPILGIKRASPTSLITVGFSSLAHRSMSWLCFVQPCTDVVNGLQTLADVLAHTLYPPAFSPDPPFQACREMFALLWFGCLNYLLAVDVCG